MSKLLSSQSLPPLPSLPIDSLHESLCMHLKSSPVLLLEAPPGTGKSTRVPLWALDCCPGRILLLEPRRLAARLLAGYLARLTGTKVGELVGLVMRREQRLSRDTRLVVVTEGVFTRMVSEDVELAGTGCVLFDEFHERHLTSDTGLALALHSQRLLRPDLRIGILSATLDTEALRALLPEAPVLVSTSPGYPVDIVHRPLQAAPGEEILRLPGHMARVILEQLSSSQGSLLAFLPGAREIRRTAELLTQSLPKDCLLYPLYGRLTAREQQQALEPAPPGSRKVVLATDIAETSLTIEGIRIVVDSGWQKRPYFDPGRGATRLVFQKIPRSSARQRAGRAGRTESGLCVRLWSREQEETLPAHARPEILEADLTGLALDLALVQEQPRDLPFVTQPPEGAFARAQAVLRELGLLDAQNGITRLGRQAGRLGLQARSACVLLAAGDAAFTAALLCALWEDEQVRSRLGTDAGTASLTACLAHLLARGTAGRSDPARVDLLATAELFWRRLPASGTDDETENVPANGQDSRARSRQSRQSRHRSGQALDDRIAASLRDLQADPLLAGRLLLPGFSDRLVMVRKGDRTPRTDKGLVPGLLRSGSGVLLPAEMAQADFVLALDLSLPGSARRTAGEAAYATALLCAPVAAGEVRACLGDRLVERRLLEVDAAGAVQARRVTLLDSLELDAQRVEPTPEECTELLCDTLVARNLAPLPWSAETEHWLARVRFLARTLGDPWPHLDTETLKARAAEWLPAALGSRTRTADITPAALLASLKNLVPWSCLSRLEDLAPAQWTSPCGKAHPVHYDGEQPHVEVKLQECFGLRTAPLIAGTVPLTLHLLSPGGKVLAMTRDPDYFWHEVYPQVRAEMRGRYPRHPWPEDPLSASPTTLTQKMLRARTAR